MFGRGLCVLSMIRAQYSSNSCMSILTGIQTRYIGYSRADRLPATLGRVPSPTTFGWGLPALLGNMGDGNNWRFHIYGNGRHRVHVSGGGGFRNHWEESICERTSFQGLSSRTTSFPTTGERGESSRTCRDNIRWFSSSVGEDTVLRTVGRLKGLLNSTASSRLPIADLLQSALTTSSRRMNIAAGSVPIGRSFRTRGA
jgi:hypothetical protein